MMLSKRLRLRNPISPPTIIGTGSSEGSSTVSFSATTAGDVGIMVASMAASVIAITSGWNRIVTLTRGTVYAKTMGAGETSAQITSTADQLFVVFFRGCSTPTTGEGTYATSIVNPDSPSTIASVVPNDMVLAITAATYSAHGVSSAMPSGYTQILYGPNTGDTSRCGIGYITGQSGLVNPGSFAWGLSFPSNAGSSTVILTKV